jgi:ribonuclease Y
LKYSSRLPRDIVKEAYALPVVREARIIARPKNPDDLASSRLTRDMAPKTKEGLQYPMRMKVTVIRETRAVDHVK